MSDDLITWLRAQLDEDEAVAGSATSGPWNNDDPMLSDAVRAPAIDAPDSPAWVADCRYEQMGPFAVHNAAHIARWNPARVLAEVDAKRRIIDRAAGFLNTSGLYGAVVEFGAIAAQMRWVLRVLALPYADRPGYRGEEWRP